jgi:hypothetical protein
MNYLLRIWVLIITEIKRVNASKAFHFVAVASPLLFLYAFAGNLAQDISFPVTIQNKSSSTQYVDFLDHFKNPQGTPYFTMKEAGNKDYPSIIIEKNTTSPEKITGHFTLIIPGIDKNMTKNYQNRLTGSIVSYLHDSAPHRYISIKEIPLYKTEPSWIQYFTVTILVLGILLSGMLFGSLSFSIEWKNDLIMFYKLSPIPPALPVVSKLIAGLCKSVTACCIYLLISTARGTMLFPGSPFFALIFIFMTISALSLGMIVGLFCKEVVIAFIASLIGAIILWITGGGFGTSLAINPVLRTIAEFNPVSWCIRLVQHSFFSGPFYMKDIILLSFFTFLTVTGLFAAYIKKIYIPGGEQRK